jgi:hypothetical protein
MSNKTITVSDEGNPNFLGLLMDIEKGKVIVDDVNRSAEIFADFKEFSVLNLGAILMETKRVLGKRNYLESEGFQTKILA